MASQDAAAGAPYTDVCHPGGEPPSFDTSIAHPARVYNYWLGGKDNYEADREAAREVMAAIPTIEVAVRANRAFLRRVVQYLAGEAGIRQFLDIGTGLPTAENTHQVAQEVAPESRIVYVDNDPIVLAHARALLTSTAEGASDYIEADLRDPDRIAEEAARLLDFSQPIALLVLCVMQYIPDSSHPHRIVSQLKDGLPPGSYLAMSDTTRDIDKDRVTDATDRFNARPVAAQFTPRTREEIARFFDGLDIIDPGLVPVTDWRALGGPRQAQSVVGCLGRKP